MRALQTFVNIPQLTLREAQWWMNVNNLRCWKYDLSNILKLQAAFLYSIYHQHAGKTCLFHLRGVHITHFNTCCTLELRTGFLSVLGLILFQVTLSDRIYLVYFPGYWCPWRTANYTDYPCPVGYVCSEGSKYWTDNPCPAGTYNNQTRRSNLTQCVTCPGETVLPCCSLYTHMI